ncbi:MAG: hypothetical protein ACOC9Z_08030, partial [Chloroflexota bacterium]
LAVGLQPFVPWAGYVLTGLLIGGGANLIHDVWPGAGGELELEVRESIPRARTRDAGPVERREDHG